MHICTHKCEMGLEGAKPFSFELGIEIAQQMSLKYGKVIFAQSTSVIYKKASD